MKTIKYILYSLILALFLISCATKATLSGGPKDIISPHLDSIKSTSNYKTNFNPKKIDIYFDEWITLKNPNQILVSPPLTKNPKYTQRGKHVTIEFPVEDTLRENTTYNINFGNNIVDYTEGNPVRDFSYIFSTGDFIDSLELSGKVIDAYDNKSVNSVLVMLYESSDDSIVIKSKPYYFSTTREDGLFKISNIKEGNYKVFALKDENSNYLFDNTKEKIGYLDTMVHIDTNNAIIEIQLFQPEPPFYIKDKQIGSYGKTKLTFSKPIDSLNILYFSQDILLKEFEADSMILWSKAEIDSVNLVIETEKNIDTLIIKTKKKYDIPTKLSIVKNNITKSLYPDSKLSLFFDSPIALYDTAYIELSDSTDIYKDILISKDSINSRKLWIDHDWKVGNQYTITFYPGAFTGLYKQQNDTIKYNFKTSLREDFGKLILSFDSLSFDEQFIVSLIFNKTEIQKFIINNCTSFQKIFDGLNPGNYSLEIVEDKNKNKRWDPGDYFKKSHPEKILRVNLSELKKNWEQKENINLNQFNTKDDTSN